MGEPDNDRWRVTLALDVVGRHEFTICGWVDRFATWRHDLERRVEAGSVSPMDLAIGAHLVRAAAGRASLADRDMLMSMADTLGDPERGIGAALSGDLALLMEAYPDRALETVLEPSLAITVDPPHARFSAWYELFPRSASAEAGRHGTFRDVIARLPYVADLGFDVLYLPPIHPIGRTFRKGPNDTLVAGPDDPGVPWAIGSEAGGHMAIHPELGTLEDFEALVTAASGRGIRLALDIAFQASADHPYLTEHPEWFRSRPDGTIQYAENPPKKYQDTYPFDFESADWPALWQELLSVMRFWVDHGVRIFRVDNPHTKPFAFWEWIIAELKARDPDVLLLSEAFTRPKVMYRLAKLGFSWSYTYFTWRNAKAELRSYMEEITRPPVSDFFRGNLFTNTPDILHAYLQDGGRPAFAARFVLAATLGASYGIYGPPFELGERVPRTPGSEEYLDSEKYQLRTWDLGHPDSLAPLIRAVNAIRRSHPALQADERLRFLSVDDEQVIAYSKHTADASDVVVVVVNLDPFAARTARVELPLADYRLDPGGCLVRDLLRHEPAVWRGPSLDVRLDPADGQAAIFALTAPGRD
jgi:starch synthase (maltosyl-transferring)